MIKSSLIKISGILLLVGTAFIIGLAFFLPRLVDINSYRDEILTSLQQSLNRKVNFSTGVFKWHMGPSFDFETVAVKEPDGSNDFLKADKVTVRLALLPLLEKQVVLKDLIVEGASVRLVRGSDGKLNIDDLVKPGKKEAGVQLRKVQVKRGTFLWSDDAIRKEGFTAVASNISLTMDHLARGKKGNLKLSCAIQASSGVPSQLSFSGTVRLPAEGKPYLETELNADVNVIQAEINRFWPYFGTYIPFGATGGRLDLATSFKGKLNEFGAKGKLTLSGVSVVWPSIFHHPVNPRQAHLDYQIKLNKNSIDMPALTFSADGFKIKGDCRLQDIASSDLRITAKATTEPFKLEWLRQWIPYGIIAKDASEYIEEHILGGTYKLDAGSLDGRISQITHMEKGDNYNVLHIKGRVEKGIVGYGSKVPSFNSIKGGLEMIGKDFILSGMTGAFGESPFKMEGKITDYPLDVPCTYPFQMEITPHAPEVAWLARLAGAAKLDFNGNSRLLLKGVGPVASYQLSGEWDMKQAIYTFPGAIRKPAGIANNLAFSAILSPKNTRLTSMTYTLSPLYLSATALLSHGKTPHLAFELQTNQFLMNETLSGMPIWQKYHPRGKMQAHITGRGNPEDFSAMDYGGSIALSAFSFQPDEKLKLIQDINGTVSFKGNSLETSSIKARYGDSAVNIKGRIQSLKDREAEVMFSSRQIFMRDLNLAPPQSDLSFHHIDGAIAFKDEQYAIKKLAGVFNLSSFNASGTYSSGRAPEADLAVTSEYLDVDDLILIEKQIKQRNGEKRADQKSNLNLKLKMKVASGKYGRLPFAKLDASLQQEGGILYLLGLDAGLFNGRLTAKGRIAPGQEQQPTRYDLNLNLEKVKAESLFQSLGITREVSGTMSLQGDVTPRGNNMQDIKKTALGNIRLQLEKGTLRKFNVLSKIFSILNFSQLLKFQLPDMVSGGMPYKHIHGSFSVHDGSLETKDLFISSDAINISVIGKANMVREDLDFTIGVQPLQTIDKIVNRIPVIGWLLTGKDKSWVTAYFEAKGKWSDPEVKAIQVKSIAKGVLNIFKRVFELPVKVFTDTGEVMLGQ